MPISGFLLDVAPEVTAEILVAAGVKGKNRLWPDERQKALRACVDGALLAAEATLPEITSGPTSYYIDQLNKAIKQPAFCKGLLALIDLPALDEATVNDLANTLRQAFTEITQGYAPEQIPDLPFDDFVLALLTGFYTTASKQPLFQPEIQINLQKGTYRLLEQLLENNVQVTRSMEALQAQLAANVRQPIIIEQMAAPTVDLEQFQATLSQILTAIEDRARLPERVAPVQLPPKTERFVGRETLVAQVQDAVQPDRVVTLWGPGGRGKTAVAWQALTGLHESGELLRRFPDGVLFHTFYGRPLTDTALAHFAQSMGIEDVRDPLGACQRALSGKQALLILDGAEDADELRRVLHVRGTNGVLITTRNQNQAPDLDYLIPVNQLEMDDAVALVRTWVTANAGAAYAADTAAVEQICEEVDRLALAVRLSGILMGKLHMPAADFLAWLRDDAFDALVDDDSGRSRNVDRLLRKTVAEVGDDSATVLWLAGQIAFLPFGEHVLRGTLTDWSAWAAGAGGAGAGRLWLADAAGRWLVGGQSCVDLSVRSASETSEVFENLGGCYSAGGAGRLLQPDGADGRASAGWRATRCWTGNGRT